MVQAIVLGTHYDWSRVLGLPATTRFKCHVINSLIMHANKAKECNYMEVGQVFAQLELAISKVCYAAW